MIREALIQDVPSMLRVAEQGHKVSAHSAVAFSRDDCEATFSDLIRRDEGLVLTDGSGAFFAGALTPYPWNYARLRLLEIGFQKLPLVGTLQAIRSRVPAGTEVVFAQEHGPRSRALAKLYRSHGLKASSLAWAMEV